ncbi:MAG TPA: DUF1559 domain-containing protein [Planctomycetaceae bacterium]
MTAFAFTAMPPARIELVDWLLTVLFGWAGFLRRVVPQMTADRGSIAVAAVALLLFTVGIHVMARRGYRRFASGRDDLPPKWRLKWTLSLVALTFVLFAAGVAITGLTHQVAWLASSDEPIAAETAVVHSPDLRTSLRWLVLGFNYQSDIDGALPPGGSFTPTGVGLHSWESHLLVGLGYQNPIDFERPWRDPVNEGHFRSVVPEFINPGFRTADFRDSEGFGLSHFAANVHTLGPNTALKPDEITDGASNTILIGEVNTGFRPWGDPVNWRDPAAGLGETPVTFGGAPSTGGATFLMADGSVRTVSDDVAPSVLRALATPAAGDQP